MKSQNPQMLLKVYYDGLCRVCSFEIDHYKKQEGADSISFIDITSPDFKAQLEGVNPVLVHRELHAKSQNGQIFIGVDSFIQIWNTLPRYRWLGRLATQTFTRRLLELSYKAFTHLRPYLPRKVADCSQSPYCQMK